MSSSGKTYPKSPAPSYGYVTSEDYPVSVTRYINNVEQRIALYSKPQRTFILSYDSLKKNDIVILKAFFVEMKGKLRSFKYNDTDDNDKSYDVRFDQVSFEYSLSDWDQYDVTLKLITVIGE